jgi:anti-sigma regulatory factor (Ser/Thr protein kinase)
MNIVESIRKSLRNGTPLRTSDISKKTGFSRKSILFAIKKMIENEEVTQIPKGPRTTYVLKEFSNNALIKIGSLWEHNYKNNNLQEHIVFENIKEKFLIHCKISEHLQNILMYAFSEMMNNAIEHSLSKNINVRFENKNNKIIFTIRDTGIGVFRNILQKRKLNNTREAIQDLLKGKVTTMPKSHSGEGIFFTSKISDQFQLKSYGDILFIDNIINDIFIKKSPRSIVGTEVTFTINTNTNKHLNNVFHPYTDRTSGDFGFNTTKIDIKLYELGGVHISRSQARRILNGLEKFSKIILDFKNIDVVGQAFVDEVFRVFKKQHPKIKIVIKNTVEPVQFMIDRVDKSK